MKLAVSKNNEFVDTYDFSSEIKELESQEFSCFLGRAESCLIQLNDHKISREHAQLTYEKGIWNIRNISQIGTFLVNGSAVNEKVLSHGDIIALGDYSLMVTIPLEQDLPAVAAIEDIVEEATLEPDLTDEIAPESEKLEDEPDEITSEFAAGGDDEVLDELNSDMSQEFTDSDDAQDENYNEYGDDAQNEYADDGYSNSDDEAYSEDDSEGGFDNDSTKVFSGFTKVYLELFGENIPFEKFELSDGEYLIGRDPDKCQIVLDDAEVSSVHAQITKKNVLCSLKDMNSANGILLNGARIETGDLVNGDEFIIGSTTFTYTVSSSFFKEASDSLMPVAENQVVEVEEIVEVDEDDPEYDSIDFEDGNNSDASSSGGGLKANWTDPVKRKKLIYGLVILVVLWVVLDDDSGSAKKKGAVKPKDVKSNSLVKKKKSNSKVRLGKGKKQVTLTSEQKEFVEATYQVAQERLAENAYQEAVLELNKIFSITPDYKESKTIYEVAKNGLAKLEELERKKQKEIDDKIRAAKVKKLVEKAKETVKRREEEVSKALFNQILELDPENFDVPQLKIELDAWVREKERGELEKAQKEAERKRKISQLSPAKSLYIQKKWNVAIIELSKFLSIKDMDEDLTKDATDMLEKSKRNLDNLVAPMLGRARSLKEGQDLKGAYEVYKKILDFDPGNKEALKEKVQIKDKLTIRARRVYRKALISESLSLFQEAKELYQEVQQISPSDSEYYIKASDKLKAFWEN